MDALRFTLPKILEPNELTPLHGVDGELVASKVFLSKITPQLTRIRQVVIQPLFLLSLIAYATSAFFHASLGLTAFPPALLLTLLVVSKVTLPLFEERCSAYLNHNQPNYIAYLENRIEYHLSHNALHYALIFAQKIPASDPAYKKYSDTLTPAYTTWCQAQLVGRSLQESWDFAHAIPLKSVQEQLVNSLTRQYEDACNVQITSYLKENKPAAAMDFAAQAFLPLKSRIYLLADQACKLYYAHQIDQILGEASLDKASLFAEAMQLVDSIPDEQVKQSQSDSLFQRYKTYCRGQIDQFIAQGHPEEAIAFANRALPLAKEDTLEIARQACDTYYDRQAKALHSKDVEKAMALAEKIQNRWKKQACVRHLAPVYEPYCRGHLKSFLSTGHLNEAAKKLGDLPNSSFKEEQMAILLQKYQHHILTLIESNRPDKAIDFAKTTPNIQLSVTLSCGERSSIIRDRYLQDILEGAASAACDQYYKTQIDKKFAKLKIERAGPILAYSWKLTKKIQDEKLKKIYQSEIRLLNEVRKNWTPELLKCAANLPYPTLEKEKASKKEPSTDLASRYIQRRHAQIISYLKNDKPHLAMQCALRTAFPELRQAIVEGSKRACDRYYEAQIDTVLKQNLKHFEDRSQALKVVAQIQDPALKEVYRAKISATYTDAYNQKRALEELAKRPHAAEKYALQIKDKKSREECLEKIGDQMHSNRLDRLFQQEGSSPAEIRSCIQKIRCAALREVKETARKAYYVRQVELLFRKKAKKTLAKKYFDDLSPEAQQTALRACQAPTNHRSSYLTQFTGFVSTLGEYDSD